MFLYLWFSVSLWTGWVWGDAVQLNSANIDTIIKENDIVMINFYADWCRFSAMLTPIWNEAADKLKAKLPDAKVVFGRIDCENERGLSTRYQISKYPTIKYITNGVLAKREYRGQRSVESFVEFVRKELEPPIKEFTTIDNLLPLLDDKKRHIIGYFNDKNSGAYNTFLRAASTLKDDCDFLVATKETFTEDVFAGKEDIVNFRPSVTRTNDDDQKFEGDLTNYEAFQGWAREHCIALVREITFDNAEELTEEGKPFLILFHHPDDSNSLKEFNDMVKSQLQSEVDNMNFVTANGLQFAHPLQHLGKSKEDLPLIAIDSFKHMYLFGKYESAKTPGKLLEFVADLHSGKLHREYHYGPDQPSTETAEEEKTDEQTGETGQDNSGTVNDPPHIPRTESGSSEGEEEQASTDPPESTFVKLGPSKNRYTILRDEF